MRTLWALSFSRLGIATLLHGVQPPGTCSSLHGEVPTNSATHNSVSPRYKLEALHEYSGMQVSQQRLHCGSGAAV